MKWQDVIPVILSILIIILVAVLENQSKLIAAITATMPLSVVLGLWVVYASAGGDQEAVNTFTTGLLIGIIPSVIFFDRSLVWRPPGAAAGPADRGRVHSLGPGINPYPWCAEAVGMVACYDGPLSAGILSNWPAAGVHRLVTKRK